MPAEQKTSSNTRSGLAATLSCRFRMFRDVLCSGTFPRCGDFASGVLFAPLLAKALLGPPQL
jgi:hypothetical protein